MIAYFDRHLKGLRRFFLALPLLLVGSLGATFFADLPGQAWVAVGFNIALALPALVALNAALPVKRFVSAIFGLSIYAYGIESLGVLSGFPYDNFSYGQALGPLIAGLVPLTLPLSWLPVLIGSYIWAQRLFCGWGPAAVHAVAALLMISFDLILDPGAAALGYWTWHEPGGYYGIPEQNYLGWILSSLLGQGLLYLFLRSRSDPFNTASITPPPLAWWGSYPLAWSYFFWGCIAIFHGMIALSLWSLTILLFWIKEHHIAASARAPKP